MRIAIASSGLGHIHRGVETWAQDLGIALRRRGIDATTFQGSAGPGGSSGEVLPCWKRFDAKTLRVVRWGMHKGGWRIGIGTPYDVEQSTFALRLWWRIRKDFDILHVQDPLVAQRLEFLHRKGLSRPRVILAHGTEEDQACLRKFSFLQHLAPNYLDSWSGPKPEGVTEFAIPNFVDIERFQPGDKSAARKACGLPEDVLVILCVAALKKHHKRIDCLIREFSEWSKAQQKPAVLVLAGAREKETDEVLQLAAELGSGSIMAMENVPRDRILSLLQAADIFALASLHEMMPIAVLEGLATGLPMACNDSPTLRWMVGEAGQLTDISQPGALAAQLQNLAQDEVRKRMSVAARARAEGLFSQQVVVDQILAMYERVAGGDAR